MRQTNGSNDDDANSKRNNKSKDTKVLYLLSISKTPLDIAIELDMLASQVYEIQQEFWSLKELHDLVFLYDEIKYYLPSFVKLFHTLKRNKLLGGERITKFLRYGDHDLPALENRIQRLTSDVIDMEWKRKQSGDQVVELSSYLSQLEELQKRYHMDIELKKQIISNLD